MSPVGAKHFAGYRYSVICYQFSVAATRRGGSRGGGLADHGLSESGISSQSETDNCKLTTEYPQPAPLTTYHLLRTTHHSSI